MENIRRALQRVLCEEVRLGLMLSWNAIVPCSHADCHIFACRSLSTFLVVVEILWSRVSNIFGRILRKPVSIVMNRVEQQYLHALLCGYQRYVWVILHINILPSINTMVVLLYV